MERVSGRSGLFVVVLLALVFVSNSAEVEDEVRALDLEENAPKAMKVEVSPSAPSVPEPGIKDLLPKHIKLLTKKFIAENGGQKPSVRDDIEIKRLAVHAAAKEINDTTQAKDALEQAERKEARLNAQIEHDHMTIFKTEQNMDYAARKAYVQADAAVIQQEKKTNKLMNKEEKLKELQSDRQARGRSANKDRKHVQIQINTARKAYKAVGAALTKAQEHDESAKQLYRLAKAKISAQKAEVKKENTYLDNVESHEAQARLEYRQAKITKEFEEENARKVNHLLSRLTAKRNAIHRFTKNLSFKAEADFKTARAGIDKAKKDYQIAKTKYDKFTQKAGQYQEDYEESLKLVKLAKMAVVNAIDAGSNAAAIKSAEKHKGLKKREKKDLKKVQREDFKSKGQQHYMNAALAELTKSEALETVARKQKDMVKQHKVTLKAQKAKIALLTAEAAKHTEAGKAAARTAKAALLKVKTLRARAFERRNDAQKAERYAENIEVPTAKRIREKADTKLARTSYKSKSELDDIATLNDDKTQITIKAKKARKDYRTTKSAMRTVKKEVVKAKTKLDELESKRDETLERNKVKMAAIKSRLKQAEDHFKRAKGMKEAEEEPGR